MPLKISLDGEINDIDLQIDRNILYDGIQPLFKGINDEKNRTSYMMN
ncbi:hypothetical protein QQ020_30275 [Fulvivirgaceae bacterium BMA12]|uniref:Uncharacterized protein n=1 Tax=Agaribacillus aureus TaxID=3051825 RepID=A0ABT8LF39_9BACT|nr:hypothetical protein [Fulvivirgaceae bacterium BMA12]